MGAVTMGKSKHLTSNLEIVKDLCGDLEGFFDAFNLDKIWSKDGQKVTVCFTAEQIKKVPKAFVKDLRRY